MNEGNKPHRNNFQESIKNRTIPAQWRTPAKFMGVALLAYGVYYYYTRSRNTRPMPVVSATEPTLTGRNPNQSLTAAKNQGVNVNK